MIEVRGVSLVYGSGPAAVPAIAELSFSVEEGEMVAVVGPSGCGKTSLLLLLDGLVRPTSGQVLIAGEEVRGVRRDVALVLQDAGLLPWKTVRQNAELALRIQKRRESVDGILAALGLSGFERRFPAELSEGMRRRVGIARALALRPRVLLMDEPMANLDSLTRERIQNLLLDLWWEMRFTAVLVTHDIEEAVFLGQRILVLTPRPARLREVLENPGMGSQEYRGSPDFLARVRALRRILGENG
ncbi:MAG: ABC transporter ATP-binding protein [Candidatus Bipolaricaulota bacterium]|nr:ABC transporter ATP-binding protein [Candidatus Bipolaricaulota bacterium]MCX7844811.1 ABC transporter ATP-binding protein [Candidatus Bipolaricaulota bacterium]MDW8152329.1 ABC transporter ATP-binding protein [Candidatus Bipolaricaulota bacterium]